jgi:ketosteroid isomerase-like protein
MNRACLILPLLAYSLCAQRAPSQREVRRTLINLENRWAAALSEGDAKALNSILSQEFVDTDEDGNQTTRRGVLAALKSGSMKMSSMRFSEVQVHAYGDTAVVTGLVTQSGAYRGQTVVPRIAFTDTFVRQNGQWRAVASHRSAIRER